MKFSVITINYNNFDGLRYTIDSVVDQTYDDFEYIIIDGGSTDGSVDVINKYASQITYWISEKDRGIYHAMNKGVAQAHGDYCIFMNSGDRFYDRDVLTKVANLITEEDVVVGKVVTDKNNSIISPPPKSGELTLYHLYSGTIPHQGAFIKTDLLRKYPYDENLKISSDWKFFVQTLIIDDSKIQYLDIYIARYELGGLSSENPHLMRIEKDMILEGLFPPRVLMDYQKMKQSECMTQTLTPDLRTHYRIDRLLFRLGSVLIKIVNVLHG